MATLAPFSKWDTRASVRCSPPHRFAADGLDRRQLFYAPELLPGWAGCAALRAADPSAIEQALVAELLAYLAFTVQLENCVVVPVAQTIVAGGGTSTWPSHLRLNAQRLLCDEAYHAYAAADLGAQVQQLAQAAPPLAPTLVDRVEEALAGLAGDQHPLARFFFAVVSETLVSRPLSRLPGDARLHLPVRHFLRDHSRDERQHHLFFAAAFKEVWADLDVTQQLPLGRLLPGFITLFLAADTRAVATALDAADVLDDEIRAGLEQARLGLHGAAELRECARTTLQVFLEAGVFEHAALREQFEAAGWTLPRRYPGAAPAHARVPDVAQGGMNHGAGSRGLEELTWRQ